MVRLQEVKGQYTISLPKGLVVKKKWIKRQELFLIFNERGNIEITDDIKSNP